MEKSVDVVEKCPYLRAVAPKQEVQETIREEFEMQYDENHVVVKVKVGETDIVKEVESHIGEAGLFNAIKMAIAHGQDPQVIYAKTGPGLAASIPNNATMDELLELSDQNKQKYAEVAKQLGVTVDELHEAIRTGTLDKLINKPEEENKEGEE